MSTTVICPNCSTAFEPTAAIAQSVRDEMKKEFNSKWAEQTKQRDEQLKQREVEISKQLSEKIQSDYEVKFKSLEDSNKLKESQLKESRQKELEFLRKMEELNAKEQTLELEIKRRLLDERSKLSEIINKEQDEKNKLKEQEHQLLVFELQKQLADQKKLAEEMQRKAEQGSMQLQGEVQELALEQMLRHAFPFDIVSEVGKGVKGADCVLTIRNSYGQECGSIIFESKRTKEFADEWKEKLKTDMRALGADVAVLVTKTMPKEMDCFGENNGVWICSYGEVKALVHVLRELVIKVYNASKRQENKGDKMTMLYSYLTSHEFSEQWRAIRDGFMAMKLSIQKERDQMEKLWKAREKQLEKVLLNATHIQGSIEGIAGMELDFNLIEDENNYLLE